MDYRVADMIIMEKYPKLFEICGVTSTRQLNDVYKIARKIGFTKDFNSSNITQAITRDDVLNFLFKTDVYDFMTL